MDFPKMMYRGAFQSKAALEAAWNTQSGVQTKQVNDAGEQEAAITAGFVEQPIDMIQMPVSAPPPAASIGIATVVTPARKGKDEPLNVNS
jgi:hypothetical protein